MNLGVYSYLAATVAYGFLTLLLLLSWRSSLQGKLLTVVIVVSAIWACLAANMAADGTGAAAAYQAFEVLRYIVWYGFLLKLLDPGAAQGSKYRKFARWALPLSVGFAGLILANDLFAAAGQPALKFTGHVLLALIGLAIIEQLYRNTSARNRWAIKYLFLGAGCIFAFDFYLYSDALLFRGIDRELWEVRSIINLAAIPLLAISAARNKSWSLDLFVSRDIVLHTTAILGGGLYLLVMAVAGYYLRDFGGSWGRLMQILFFSLALVLLVVVMFSAQLRAQARVFLGKHFYKNKYDYRHEWLRLTRELSEKVQGDKRFEGAVQVLGQIVDARAGALWLRDDQGRYRNVGTWQVRRIDAVEPEDTTLARFLREKGFVVNLLELASHADEYKGLQLPEWLASIPRAWLIVPLFAMQSLLGFVILANPLVTRSINWEDRDLLKTAARQLSSYLAVLLASDALAEAKQFEVFNRLSAYMVHDLKNIAAELELVKCNAVKHKGRPGFLEDALETVANASADIKRLLDQLRNKQVSTEKKVILDLGRLLQEVVAKKQDRLPQPGFDKVSETLFVAADKTRLANVLVHLIDNAQEATPADGEIAVTLKTKDEMHIIEIRDSGHGMDADFVSHRLFKPFDTTKGNAGMGIGMYESREFIRALGGEVYVTSEPGRGTVVALHIPSSLDAAVPVSVTA